MKFAPQEDISLRPAEHRFFVATSDGTILPIGPFSEGEAKAISAMFNLQAEELVSDRIAGKPSDLFTGKVLPAEGDYFIQNLGRTFRLHHIRTIKDPQLVAQLRSDLAGYKEKAVSWAFTISKDFSITAKRREHQKSPGIGLG